MIADAATVLPLLKWRVGQPAAAGERLAVEEAPVALVHQATTTAVMMATPTDLEDFAVGFTMSEGIVDRLEEIESLEIAPAPLGIEVRMWLSSPCAARLSGRRRHQAGPTGCGLCGIESLAAAARPAPRVEDRAFAVSAEDLLTAMGALDAAQRLGQSTRAAHAAALWRPAGDLVAREDVGRHNALDKLIGATATTGGGQGGVLLLTSRVSVEMIQKAAVLGAPVVCAISAPTGLAVRTAEAAGLTLVGVSRADGFEVFTHPHRVVMTAPAARHAGRSPAFALGEKARA